MSFKFSLKETQPLDIVPLFQQYLITVYQSQDAFTAVQNALRHISNLRAQINIRNIEFQMRNQLPDAQTSAENLLLYYAYLKILQKRFRLEPTQPGALQIPFKWKNSFQAAEFVSYSSINFEISSVLYNYAIVCFSVGQILIESPTSNDLTNGVKLLRQVFWATEELKKSTFQINSEILDKQADLTLQNLTLLTFLTQALIYKGFYTSTQIENNDKTEIFKAQIVGQSLKHYQDALQVITIIQQTQDIQIPQQWLEQVKAQATFGMSKATQIAALRMQKHYSDIIIQNQTQPGHIEYAIAFLRKGIQVLQNCQERADITKNLTPNQIDEIKALKLELESPLKELEFRNNQIYKRNIPAAANLPAVYVSDPKHVALVRLPDTLRQAGHGQGIQTPLPYENDFARFLTNDQMQLSSDVLREGESIIQRLEANSRSLKTQKQQRYDQNKINVILDMTTADSINQSQSIPGQIQQQLQILRQQVSYEQLGINTTAIYQKAESLVKQLERLKADLQQEENDDIELRRIHQDKWTRQPSERFTQAEKAQIEHYLQKLNQAQQINKDLINQHKELKEFGGLIILSDQEILQRIPKNDRQYFFLQNEQLFVQLHTINSQIVEHINNADAQIEMNRQQITNNNFMNEIARLDMQGIRDAQQIRIGLLRQLNESVQQIDAQIGICGNKINQIFALATEIQGKLSQNNQNTQQFNAEYIHQQISTGLAKIVEMYVDADEGLKFNQVLEGKIEQLSSRVKAIIEARQMEKCEMENQLLGAAPNLGQRQPSFGEEQPINFQFFNYSQMKFNNNQQPGGSGQPQ